MLTNSNAIQSFLKASPTPWPTLARVFGYTQTKLSQAAAVPQGHVSKIWAGGVRPNRSTIRRIFDVLPVRAEWIPGWAEDIRAIPDFLAEPVESPAPTEIAPTDPYEADDLPGAPPPVTADAEESLACALRLAQSLVDPSIQSGTIARVRSAALAVIAEQPPTAAIRWANPQDLVWVLWLGLRAVESIVDGEMDWAETAPATVVRSRALVLGRDADDDWEPVDAVPALEPLMAYAVSWANHEVQMPGAPVASTEVNEPASLPSDPAWEILQGAWKGLDLADRARLADLAQRLARPQATSAF